MGVKGWRLTAGAIAWRAVVRLALMKMRGMGGVLSVIERWAGVFLMLKGISEREGECKELEFWRCCVSLICCSVGENWGMDLSTGLDSCGLSVADNAVGSRRMREDN